MFNKNIKLVIAVLIFAYAIYQFVEGFIGNGIMYILLCSVFVLLYFKNEFILLAFFQLRKQNFPGADKWLNRIKNPKSALTKKQQGYYNFLKGIMVSQTNMNEAEKYFKNESPLRHNVSIKGPRECGVSARTLSNESPGPDSIAMVFPHCGCVLYTQCVIPSGDAATPWYGPTRGDTESVLTILISPGCDGSEHPQRMRCFPGIPIREVNPAVGERRP